MAAEDEWVEVKRTVDPIDADITIKFLREHGISVTTRGASGANSALPHIQSTRETRIVVPRGELEAAREALTAMTADAVIELVPELQAEATEGPYRSGGTHGRKGEGAVVERSPRSKVAGVFLAFLVPIGGGHFYARHNDAGFILGAGTVGLGIAAMVIGNPAPFVGAAVIVLLDAVTAPLACARCNEGRIPASATQRSWAVGAVLAGALVTAFMAR